MSVFKKIVIVLAIVILLILIGIKPIMKRNPPLEIGTIAWLEKKNGVVIQVGNKGWKKIDITEVSVNTNERPLNVKIQVNNALKPLIVTDSFINKEAKNYVFKNINSISIEPNTSPSYILEKENNGTLTGKDKIYGISVLHDESINKIIIKYRYLSLQFEKELSVR
ncbi:hypothetical protein [Gottfriedia solisilvae]|uniref:Uncharacterized protein n=1 Tax=Gottfriedia solisilvae TaxID=1516104 RepID=A0A8J3AFF5_9BACI|nr:hypothetical protein [Gottfriedia solisilvae]GGI11498.1 hypothetical protein GCM10007380_08140 [Gottfriedia solisilvae]